MTAPADGMTVPVVATDRPYVTVWTDGSSTGRWGPGGWAWCVIDGPQAGRCDSGGDGWTSNNRMELQAAHEAVRALSGLLLVCSDSQYVVRCFTDEWWRGWARKSWRKVANADLWQPFVHDVLDRRGEVRFAWVRGHVGHPGNEEADRLAKAAKQVQAAMLREAGHAELRIALLCAVLMVLVLTRIKGLCSGALDAEAVMAEIEGDCRTTPASTKEAERG